MQWRTPVEALLPSLSFSALPSLSLHLCLKSVSFKFLLSSPPAALKKPFTGASAKSVTHLLPLSLFFFLFSRMCSIFTNTWFFTWPLLIRKDGIHPTLGMELQAYEVIWSSLLIALNSDTPEFRPRGSYALILVVRLFEQSPRISVRILRLHIKSGSAGRQGYNSWSFQHSPGSLESQLSDS